MEEKEQFKYLYNQYLHNRCTADELKQFFNLLNERQDKEEIMTLLSDTWDQTDTLPEEGLIPPFLKPEAKQVKLEVDRHKHYGFKKWIGVAALLVALTGIYFYQSSLTSLFNPATKYELAHATTKRKQLQLADGTKVWLSPNSTLSYPAKFDDNERLVTLDGEAFFEVTHDAKHPFIIKSGDVSTTVLGTSFNVAAYTKQHTINVTLVTGKVAVALNGNNNTKRDTITANQRLIIDKTALSITKVDYPDAAAFLNKRLGLFDYKGAALQEVIKDLENQYNIQIQLDSELYTKTFYGGLNMTDSLNETLDKLCTVMETKWEKDGGTYAIIK
ncbi:FecR family protein [Pedobacter nyackensis]|uniref:FecR family protein n=1 Tax=Pedobacter nyackensis TaxID=475255 RepID=UPI00292CD42C|nr:FecR family protein [Pedobacter nyackensis]